MCLGTVLALAILGPVMSHKAAPFSGEGSPLRQVFYLATLATAVWALRPIERPDRLAQVPTTMVLAVAYCWISLAWAIEPGIAVRRLMLATILIWIIFILVAELGYRTTITITRMVLVGTLVANFATVLLLPQIGIHQTNDLGDVALIGAWRGIMMQKNFAGVTCAATILMFMFDARAISLTARGAVIVASALFLAMSQSKTSAGLTLVATVAGLAYLRYDPRYRALLVPLLLVVAVAAALLSIHYADTVRMSLENPQALTGRAQIWPVLVAYAQDHWLLGSGYGSFWNIGLREGPVYEYGTGWVTDLGNGHNGYLDILVQVGVPGLVLVVFAAMLHPLARLLTNIAVPRARGAMLFALLVFCAGHNGTESSLFDRDMLVQVFLMLTVALIRPAAATSGRALIRARPRPVMPTGRLSRVRPHA